MTHREHVSSAAAQGANRHHPAPPSAPRVVQVIARKYVSTAAAEGQWVLLQNTHLGLGYLAEVEHYLAKVEELHEDFRWGGAPWGGG